MSDPKPNMAPMYGAAFGFNTARRVKPVHFATGFFVSLLRRHYPAKLLNYTVAFTDGKDMSGLYALHELHPELAAKKAIAPRISQRDLHTLRTHLRCLARNDEAVSPAYAEKAGFGGCDYTTASQEILTWVKDNDGFTGHFCRLVLEQSAAGRAILDFAAKALQQNETTWHQVFQPLLENEQEDIDLSDRYDSMLGGLAAARAKRISKLMEQQIAAVKCLCENLDRLVAPETRLRFIVMGLCVWLFRYLIQEALADTDEPGVLLCDLRGDSVSRLRGQSRWSYARIREALVASFARFADEGRFDDCTEAWDYVVKNTGGRPEFEVLYGTLALRSGLAQPRASRVPAKHFEPQPDTLRMLVLSVLRTDENPVSIVELANRLFATWGLCFGAREEDGEMLREFGYSNLDQDQDLTPNTEALIEFLSELGLATRYSDGVVMCHSEPHF